ncbi:MAG: LacI family DNA-binding transcriptional regulator [Candidatus Izemoplasmatales bacterium]|nr:LacI family DNA-binding transcriptional regulator [Candidatus Izemoplasmatales bacterium]
MNIKDIANKCNLSVATISRVINNDPKVADSTRKKVLSVIDKYKFVPNITGRSLRTQKSNKILVLLPTMSNQFYSEIIQGIEETAEEKGYAILVAVTNLQEHQEIKYLHMLRMKHVDGCISLFNTIEADAITSLAKNYPFVQCCEPTMNADVSSVEINNRQAVYDVVKQFIDKGHKTIGMISGDYYKTSELGRETGYQDALRDYGIKFDKNLVVKNFYRYEDGAIGAKKLMAYKPRPTAIVCASDSLALGATSYLKSQGIKVGVDVCVMGFDNTSITTYTSPTLSSINQPRYDLGKESFKLLYEKLQDINSVNKKIILPFQIIHRESTGCDN